jgi:RND family efflux transporter MFP subunit
MNATPRLRGDLQAVPTEEGGIKYFDVRDPLSGEGMRLYEHEWLIAQRMDGRRPFDDVAAWASKELGVQPSSSDLATYASTLAGLGFLDDAHVEPVDDEATPLPKPAPGVETSPGWSPNAPPKSDGPIAARPEVKPAAADAAHAATMMVEAPSLPVAAPAPPPVATAATMAMPAPAPVVAAAPTPPAPAAAPAPAATPAEWPSQPTLTASQPPAVPAPVEKKSSAGSALALVGVLAAIGGGVYLVNSKVPPAKVTVMTAAPSDIVQLFDGAGSVQRTEQQVFSFGEAGKVAQVVQKGATLKAGEVLATLESAAALDKQLVEVKERLGYYQKQLVAANAKGGDAAAAAQAKVDEKQKAESDLVAKLARLRLTAPAGGVVNDVLVAQGSEVSAGAPVAKMGESRLVVTFPAGEGSPKMGEQVTLQQAGGATLQGKVATVAGGSLTIDLPTETSGLKNGDSLKLVKGKLGGAVRLPAGALVQREGGDAVLVVSEGKAHVKKVSVAERSGDSIIVSSGLSSGDSVVTSGNEALQEGQAVTQ